MNTFSRVAIAMVGMTGLAVAQPKTDAPRPDAKAGGGPDMGPPAELAAMAKGAAGIETDEVCRAAGSRKQCRARHGRDCGCDAGAMRPG